MLKKIIGRQKTQKTIKVNSFYNNQFLANKFSIEDFFTNKKNIFFILPHDPIVLWGLIPIYKFFKKFFSANKMIALLNENFFEFKEFVTDFNEILFFSDFSVFDEKNFQKIKNYVLESDLIINFLETDILPEIFASYGKLSVNFNGKKLRFFNINYDAGEDSLEDSILQFFMQKIVFPPVFYKFNKEDVYNMISFLYDNGYSKSKYLINLNYNNRLSETNTKGNFFLNSAKTLISNNKYFLLINVDDEDLRSRFYSELSEFNSNLLFINKLNIKEQVILSGLSHYSIFNFSYYYLLSSLYCRNNILLINSIDLGNKLKKFYFFKQKRIVYYDNFDLKKNFEIKKIDKKS